MHLLAVLPLLVGLLVHRARSACPDGAENEVVFKWDPVNNIPTFNWPSDEIQSNFENVYKPPIGIKVFGDFVYFAFPRWGGSNFPVTLAKTEKPTDTCIQTPTAPLLTAFPDWSMQEVGNCDAFQYIQSFEITPDGLMWLPDVGRVTDDQADSKAVNCPAKLVVLNVTNGEVVKVHEFDDSVVDRTTNFLNDIVVDISEGDGGNKFAFIADASDGVIIVYDFDNDQSWRVDHPSMKVDPNAISLNFLNPDETLNVEVAVDGIALTPPDPDTCETTLYYCPLSSNSMFWVSANQLKNASLATSIQVASFQNKPSQADGLAADSNGQLYMTEIVLNSISAIDVSGNIPDRLSTRQVLAQDNSTMIWPDTLSIEGGYLWATTRGWPLDEDLNAVIRIPIQAETYMQTCADVKESAAAGQRVGELLLLVAVGIITTLLPHLGDVNLL